MLDSSTRTYSLRSWKDGVLLQKNSSSEYRTWGRTQFFGAASRTPHVRFADHESSSNFVFKPPNFGWYHQTFLISDKFWFQTGQTDGQTDAIEDVERGAEFSFSGPLRGPCIIVKFCFQTTKFWLVSPNFFGFRQVLVSDRTDRRTDGRTDRRNKYVLGLPCFLKN